jgi:hypothetical protein
VPIPALFLSLCLLPPLPNGTEVKVDLVSLGMTPDQVMKILDESNPDIAVLGYNLVLTFKKSKATLIFNQNGNLVRVVRSKAAKSAAPLPFFSCQPVW